jgi:ABC-2 type transport system ATP-binding protein
MDAWTVENLVKRYANGVEALKGVSLSVAEGDFFALLGPNGAGKSTMIGITCTLVDPSGGDVRVFGHSIRTARAAALAQIGVVPQEFNFNQFEKPFEICVNQAGYYGVPRKVAEARAEQYLNALQLWDKRNAVSRTLSGGMKRRLMIARAMMNQPKLLILDEPTAGVDIEVRRSMWRYLTEINQAGVTVILTTHYLEEAENLCRNIAIIDHGRIVEHTSMRQLLAKLDRETFVLDCADPVTRLPALAEMTLRQIDPLTLEVDVPRGQPLNALFGVLTEAGISVKSLRNKANRLEELFVRLTSASREVAA